MKKTLRVGLIGLGTVGCGVVSILQQQKNLIASRLGCPIEIARVADLNLRKKRSVTLPKSVLTTDAMAVINDPHIDIVVELIGGYDPAKRLLLAAIGHKKHVVTANKALLAEHGEEIFRAASCEGVRIGFEASVGGGVPIIRAIREGFSAEQLSEIYGIVNGTCNYILGRMTDEGRGFSEVLSEAQHLGYAEADPILDVGGGDSAHKLMILAHLAFGVPMALKEVFTEGIAAVTPDDIAFAREFGYRIKLLAIAKAQEGELEMRVHPTMIPDEHLLSRVSGVYNAIYVAGPAIGDAIFYGKGAGGLPTGCAVISDLIDIGREIVKGKGGAMALPYGGGPSLRMKRMEEIESCYYLRFMVKDRPGVLSQISGILGRHHISISSVIQKGRKAKGAVPLVMMTHRAKEKAMQEALLKISRLDCVARPSTLIRVEGGNDGEVSA